MTGCRGSGISTATGRRRSPSPSSPASRRPASSARPWTWSQTPGASAPHEHLSLMASLPPIDTPSGATGAGAFDAPARDENGALFDTLLRLGDDALVLGQRLGEWTGHAASVEVDPRLAN